MSVILVLIPLSIICAAGFLAAFIWAVRSGQYEDTCTPSMRLLLDDSVKKTVAQVSKPAVSPISKSADATNDNTPSDPPTPADLAICDTAGSEVGATKAGAPQSSPLPLNSHHP